MNKTRNLIILLINCCFALSNVSLLCVKAESSSKQLMKASSNRTPHQYRNIPMQELHSVQGGIHKGNAYEANTNPNTAILNENSRMVTSFLSKGTNIKSDNDNDQEEKCPICLEDLNNNVRTLSCNHEYHKDCIAGWLRKQCSCPMCGDIPQLSCAERVSHGLRNRVLHDFGARVVIYGVTSIVRNIVSDVLGIEAGFSSSQIMYDCMCTAGSELSHMLFNRAIDHSGDHTKTIISFWALGVLFNAFLLDKMS